MVIQHIMDTSLVVRKKIFFSMRIIFSKDWKLFRCFDFGWKSLSCSPDSDLFGKKTGYDYPMDWDDYSRHVVAESGDSQNAVRLLI